MITVLVILALLLGAMAYVRFAPVDIDHWHVNPDAEGRASGPRDYKLSAASDANGPAINTSMSVEQSIEAASDWFLSQPKSKQIAGIAYTGFVTFELRTKLVDYPDYYSVKVAETEEGSAISVYGRARFGRSDLGVNKARLNAFKAFIEGQEAQ